MKKPVIVDIVLSEEKLNELNSELSKKQTLSKPAVIRKFAGGTCMYCGDVPMKKLLIDVGDGDKLVQFYCDKCYKRWVVQ